MQQMKIKTRWEREVDIMYIIDILLHFKYDKAVGFLNFERPLLVICSWVT